MTKRQTSWMFGVVLTLATTVAIGPLWAQPDEDESLGRDPDVGEDGPKDVSPVIEPEGNGKSPRSKGAGDPGPTSAGGSSEIDSVGQQRSLDSNSRGLSVAGNLGGANDSAIATPGQTSREERADFDVSVFGYVRLLVGVVQDDPEVSFVGRNDGFRMQNARIGVEGRFRDRIFVRISADGADEERAGANAVQGTLRFGLKDAFADALIKPSLQLRVGRFPILFDIERFTSAVQRGFIRRSLESRGVSALEGFESPGLGVARNLGVAVRAPRAYEAESFALGYEVAAQNGNGELDANNDNDHLAYSGTGLLFVGQSAFVFASVRFNQRTEGDLAFRRNERDLSGAFGAWISIDPLRIAGQFLVQRTTFPTTAADSEIGSGGHLEALVVLPGTGLTGGYRFALLDESDRMTANRVIEHTATAGYDLPSYGMRFKLDITLPVEQAGRELKNARAEALVEVRL